MELENQCKMENTQLGFNPKKLSHILLLKRKLFPESRRIDMECIIKICVERGENLDFIRLSSKIGLIELLDVYNKRYDLVSHENDSKIAVTLSRITKCFPKFTCWYLLNSAKNPTVSFETMNEICKNYPKVMMTPAFAFLIPNTNDNFCVLLKNAHMLHQCEFQRENLNFQRMTRADRKFAAFGIINNVIRETEAAIAESHINDKMQLQLLEEFNLISVNEAGIIVVPEEVINAAMLWEEKLINHKNAISLKVDIIQLGHVTETVI